jgi:hypothetical protein
MVGKLARTACGLALTLACLAAGSAAAQEAVLTDLYGKGVHGYFSGRCDSAIDYLSSAINGGTKDPRAFYFRALAEMRQGRSDEATLDMQMGASLETADVNQFYPVGKSLERVQGAARQTLERYRATARAEAFERQRARDTIRYEQRRRAEAEVLRKPGVAPPGGPALPPQPPAAVPAKPDAADDLFSEEVDKEKPPAAPEPPAADEAPADDAMPDEAAPAADAAPAAEPPDAKADDDPFTDDTEKAK